MKYPFMKHEKSVTRFAPAPTGYLHIGSARIALINWLHSRKSGGRFLLRIEDTDSEREKSGAIDVIINSLKWLGLDWDGDAVFQSHRIDRHIEVGKALIEKGMAYYCYSSKEDIEEYHRNFPNTKFISKWSDPSQRDLEELDHSISPVIRLHTKKCLNDTDSIVFHDTLRGDISTPANEIEDLIIVRSDGRPTYMLAVVVDDHDMSVNHIIRGADHITNTPKQILIYRAMGWDVPQYTHIPLIHDIDGNKLSKRKGAASIEEYHEMGYLPQAMLNYLLRLGWGGDGKSEIVSIDEAMNLFSINDLSKSPSKFDITKLRHINSFYITSSNPDVLVLGLEELYKLIKAKINDKHVDDMVFLNQMKKVAHSSEMLKKFATLLEIIDFTKRFLLPLGDNKNIYRDIIFSDNELYILRIINNKLSDINEDSVIDLKKIIENTVNDFNSTNEGLLNKITTGSCMKMLRKVITFGVLDGPSLIEIIKIIGISELKHRLDICFR